MSAEPHEFWGRVFNAQNPEGQNHDSWWGNAEEAPAENEILCVVTYLAVYAHGVRPGEVFMTLPGLPGCIHQWLELRAAVRRQQCPDADSVMVLGVYHLPYGLD